jgi:type IV pilus assembly protein PilE
MIGTVRKSGSQAGRSGRRMRGVTLMELLVVVAIIGIIAAVAVPTYRKYMIRTNRAEAKIALLQLQTAQEKFYMQNNSFTDDITGASPGGLGLTLTTETGKYAIDIDLAEDGQTYLATATPTSDGGQSDDEECADFTITQRGTRGVTGPKGTQACWR